jgi:hypothetical protein
VGVLGNSKESLAFIKTVEKNYTLNEIFPADEKVVGQL